MTDFEKFRGAIVRTADVSWLRSSVSFESDKLEQEYVSFITQRLESGMILGIYNTSVVALFSSKAQGINYLITALHAAVDLNSELESAHFPIMPSIVALAEGEMLLVRGGPPGINVTGAALTSAKQITDLDWNFSTSCVISNFDSDSLDISGFEFSPISRPENLGRVFSVTRNGGRPSHNFR